jgi:hypothetical protein
MIVFYDVMKGMFSNLVAADLSWNVDEMEEEEYQISFLVTTQHTLGDGDWNCLP